MALLERSKYAEMFSHNLNRKIVKYLLITSQNGVKYYGKQVQSNE